MRLIIVRPSMTTETRTEGWEVSEIDGVCPVFLSRRQAVSYALFRSDGWGAIEVRDKDGKVIRSCTPEQAAEAYRREQESLPDLPNSMQCHTASD